MPLLPNQTALTSSTVAQTADCAVDGHHDEDIGHVTTGNNPYPCALTASLSTSSRRRYLLSDAPSSHYRVLSNRYRDRYLSLAVSIAYALTPSLRGDTVRGMVEHRRTGRCGICGRSDVEIATSGQVTHPQTCEPLDECYACYRRRQREEQQALEESSLIVDRHSVPPSLRKLRKQLSTAFFGKFLVGMDDMNLPEGEIQKHIDMVRPYLEPIKDRLPPSQSENSRDREQRHSGVFMFANRGADDADGGES
jgi:hypothetical protein